MKKNIVIQEIQESEKYAIMLMEELYEKMGIDTYHNFFFTKGSQTFSFYVKRKGCLIVSPQNYLEAHCKVMDENSGRRARASVDESYIENINIMKQSFAADFDSLSLFELMRQIYAMYGINALASSNYDGLECWEFLLQLGDNLSHKFIAKSNNPNFCDLNQTDSIDDEAANKKLEDFVKMVMGDFSIAYPVAQALCSISPNEIILEVEKERKVLIPEECKIRFVEKITGSQQALIQKINDYGKKCPIY